MFLFGGVRSWGGGVLAPASFYYVCRLIHPQLFDSFRMYVWILSEDVRPTLVWLRSCSRLLWWRLLFDAVMFVVVGVVVPVGGFFVWTRSCLTLTLGGACVAASLHNI